MTKVFSILKIALKNPIKSLSQLNIRNLRSLIYALKYEDSNTIQQNLNLLLSEEESALIIPAIPHEPTKHVQVNHQLPIPEKDKEFYNTWDDKYILKHYKELSNHETIDELGGQNIVIIADLNLPQCKKYRVLQKIEYLKRKGIQCDFSHWLDEPRSLKLMQTASTVLFYRIPFSKLSAVYLNEAVRLKLNIGYDIDDPIFDNGIYKENKNLDVLDKKEKADLLNNSRHYVNIIRQCDFITTSTPYLKSVLSRYTKSPVYLWRNLMDAQTINAATITKNISSRRNHTNEKEFIIGYMSGSRAHEADFNTAKNALIQILDTHKNVKLFIVGYADSAKQMKEDYKDRIIISPYANYYDYISSYHKIDLNIIPLLINEFNECKSAIRYLESSLLSIPTIVSNVGDFKNIISHKETGYFVYTNTENEWVSSLEWCLSNRDKINELGKKAEKLVTNKYTTLQSDISNIDGQIFTSEL